MLKNPLISLYFVQLSVRNMLQIEHISDRENQSRALQRFVYWYPRCQGVKTINYFCSMRNVRLR